MGRAIAQAVSRRLPTAAARTRAQVRSCRIGAGFLQVLWFPLPILIPPTAHTHDLLSGAAKIGHLVADLPRGLSLTAPPRNLKKEEEERRMETPYRKDRS
jgi:arylamine N-acetyltransferase